MKAKKKEITAWDAVTLNISPNKIGKNASRINVKKLSYPPVRKRGKILEGDSKAVTKELVNLLRNEAKVV